MSPRINLYAHVCGAREQGRLVITVPWVVEYLSMIDQLAPQLDHIKTLLQLLLRLYRRSSSHFGSERNESHLLLLLHLGWLFEVSQITLNIVYDHDNLC